MDDEKSLNQAPLSDSPQARPSPYELLIRQSRKMGGLAARTYDVTKEFLQQDVSALHPDKVLFGNSANRTMPATQNDAEVERIVSLAEGPHIQIEHGPKTLDPRE